MVHLAKSHRAHVTRTEYFDILCEWQNQEEPICSITILYNLFKQQQQPTLDNNQSADQAGFRPGHYSTFSLSSNSPTDSHRVASATVGRSHRLQKKSHRHSGAQQRMDGFEGSEALRPATRSVHTDVESKHFHLERGTKQGDPLCMLLSNSLIQCIMKPLTGKWKRCNQGVRLAEHDPNTNLCNLRFCRRHSSHLWLAEAHDHHAGRPHHSCDGTWLPPHENQNHLSNTTVKRGTGNTVAV